MEKVKESVVLRSKPLKGGGASLYLDYREDGVRRKEYLKMYLVPERTKADRWQNAETLRTADALRARRTVELQNGQAGFRRRPEPVRLAEYLERRAGLYAGRGGAEYARSLGKLARWVTRYDPKVTLGGAGREFLTGFFAYLSEPHPELASSGVGRRLNGGLSPSTINQYAQMLSTQFNCAVRDGLCGRNPVSLLAADEKPKRSESEREYLTMDELKTLASTPCRSGPVRRAFLFSCFTGLRLSDIESLEWSDIRSAGDGLEVSLRQVKTGTQVYVPLTDNARGQLGEPSRAREGRVFEGLPSRSEIGRYLSRWVGDAGIGKHITFHCARHTFATLLLTYGADIYTVSKLLGHSDIGVTQVYAKVIDAKRREAAELVPSL